MKQARDDGLDPLFEDRVRGCDGDGKKTERDMPPISTLRIESLAQYDRKGARSSYAHDYKASYRCL